MSRRSQRLVDIMRLMAGLLDPPKGIGAIFRDAWRRQQAEAARLDASDPGWRERSFEGPDDPLSFPRYVELVAQEQGRLEEIRAWMKTLLRDAQGSK
jgi:hypothetical protein